MIYLDNAATTRVFPEAAQAAYDAMTDGFGNPESLHGFGLRAEQTVSAARRKIAQAAGVGEDEIFFAPCATVADNAILRGAVKNKRSGRIISTAFEHPAVEETLKELEQTFEVVRLRPEHGLITVDAFRAVLSPDTVLVSCMQVNNETGAVTPLREMAAMLKQSGIKAIFHTDAVQGFLKEDLRYSLLDAATFAGHKVHAPKGIGALYLKKGTRIRPFYGGGGQEKDLFSGTHNVPAIAAWGKACEIGLARKAEARENVAHLNLILREGLIERGAKILSPENASPYVLSAYFPGILGENILQYLSAREIYLSTGSACSAGKPSPVMEAIGLGEISRYVLRFSFCGDNTEDEIRTTLSALSDALRDILPVRK